MKRIKGPKKLPSLRRLLISINLDLISIKNIIYNINRDEFNEFEYIVILLEDRRYFRHGGIDYLSIIRELIHVFTGHKCGGFSTIEMQLVRTVTGRYERKIKRKIYEMTLAFLCNFHFSKFEILNTYISIAYFGTEYQVNLPYNYEPNCDSVSRNLFGCCTSEINAEQAAQIAAYLVYPRPRDPNSKWEEKIQRRKSYGLKLFNARKREFQKLKSGQI